MLFSIICGAIFTLYELIIILKMLLYLEKFDLLDERCNTPINVIFVVERLRMTYIQYSNDVIKTALRAS